MEEDTGHDKQTQVDEFIKGWGTWQTVRGKQKRRGPGMAHSRFLKNPSAYAWKKGISKSDAGDVDINQPAHMLLGNVVSQENNSDCKYLVYNSIKDPKMEILLE